MNSMHCVRKHILEKLFLYHVHLALIVKQFAATKIANSINRYPSKMACYIDGK